MALATAAAIAALVGTTAQVGSTIANTVGNKDNPYAKRQNDIAAAGLQDSRNNDAYQRALSTLINQRSIAGSQDDYGSGLQYDPATNTWVSKLGAQPKQVQDASDIASILRNTTDLRQAQNVNEAAVGRATAAGPLADTARRNLETYRDMPSDQLTGLLMQRATDASNATFKPMEADILRSMQRTGTAAAPVMASLGRTQYDALRDSLADAQIKGLTGVDQINTGRRQGLEQTAATTGALATPQLQYPGLSTSSNRDTLANLMAARAQQGGVAPAYGMGGVNTAAGQTQAGYKQLQSSVPTPDNSLTEAGKQIGSALGNKSLGDNLSQLFGKTKAEPSWIGQSGGEIDQPKVDALMSKLQPFMNDTQGNAAFSERYTVNGDGSF
jgi:hypothetical protein